MTLTMGWQRNRRERRGCGRSVPRAGSLGLGPNSNWRLDHAMKTFSTILLFALLMSSSGCMTYSTVQRAKGEHNVITGHSATEPHPGYYALLPLAVPADIATSPIQLLLYLLLGSSNTPL